MNSDARHLKKNTIVAPLRGPEGKCFQKDRGKMGARSGKKHDSGPPSEDLQESCFTNIAGKKT